MIANIKIKVVVFMNTVLSVVVPVYNVEQYLSRCIDSILNQTFTEFELILVNDGSTDNCPIICDEYAKRDSRIKVIHKQNGGLSDARNAGIDLARGKYISFIDSDDFIINTSYEKLLYQAEKNELDIITGNAIEYYTQDNQSPKGIKRSFANEVMNGIDFLVRSYIERAMLHCVQYSIYRLDLIKDNNLYFKKGILHEDNLWTPQIFLKAKRVMYYDLDFYMHYQREGSITKRKDKTKNGIDLVNICYELEKIYKCIQDDKVRAVLNDVLVSTYLRGVCIGRLTRKEYKDIINRRFVLGKSRRIKNKFKSAFFFVCPYLYVTLFQNYYK